MEDHAEVGPHPRIWALVASMTIATEVNRLRRLWRIVGMAFEPPVLVSVTPISGRTLWLDEDWKWHEEAW
jgi:hypothetical protein